MGGHPNCSWSRKLKGLIIPFVIFLSLVADIRRIPDQQQQKQLEAQGEDARVRTTISMTTTHTATVRIVRFDPNCYYSVLAMAFQKYTIAGTQKQKPEDTNEQFLEFTLQFVHAGNYDVIVYESKLDVEKGRKNGRARKLPTIVPPSPLPVTIHDDDDRKAVQPVEALLPCQSLPNSDSLLPWHGNWLGPNATAARTTSRQMMRTGWYFAPKICQLETWNQLELADVSMTTTSTSPTTIAVLGTSRERGIFLSMVDMALQPEEKREFDNSIVAKCWGRAQIKVNHHLKFIYQDFRTQVINPKEDDHTITCHDNKVALGSGMYQNATKMINHLIASENPNVIVFWSGCYASNILVVSQLEEQRCATTLVKLMEQLPSSWNGTVYVTDAFMKEDDPALTETEFPIYLHNLQHLSRMVNDTRVRFLEVHSLVSPMRLYGERTGVIRGSTHWHGWCDQAPGIRVCSNVTEALAQLILGRALAPDGKSQRPTVAATHSTGSSLATSTNRSVEICTECPKTLLPMHIKQQPDLTCTQGALVAVKEAGEPYSLQCPCFHDQAPTDQVQTRSGPVDVRVCPTGNGDTWKSIFANYLQNMFPMKPVKM